MGRTEESKTRFPWKSRRRKKEKQMKPPHELKAPDILLILDRVLVLAVVIWTVLLGGMLVWNFLNTKELIKHTAYEVASEHVHKDILYGQWAYEHGGLYIAVTEKTQPTPYFKIIKERDITTSSGRHLTLVTPPYMTRPVHELESGWLEIKEHITSNRQIRPENKPDTWERNTLDALEGGKKEFGEVVMMDGSPHYRLMIPLFIEKSCLQCHAFRGYKVGDLRGGISTAVPMKLFDGLSREHNISAVRQFAAIWLLGMAGILLIRPYIRGHVASREQAEKLLQESEERYRKLIELSSDAIYVHVDGRFVFSNAEGARLLGVNRPEDLYGRQIMDFVHPEHRNMVREWMRRISEKKRASPLIEEIYVRLDGSNVYVEVTAIPFLFEGRSALLVEARDISKRKEVERLLRKADAQYRTIVDTALEGILAIDGNGTITLVNARVPEMIGYSLEEMLGRSIYEFVHEDERREHQIQTELRSKGISSQFERRFRRKDGGVIWTLVSASPLFDDHGTFQGSFAMFNDITERKGAEEAMRRSELRLREAQQLAQMGNWEWDIDERLLTWSDETYRIFGREPGTFVPSVEVFEAAIHPEDREDLLRWRNLMLSEKVSANIEHRIILPDGNVRYVHEHAQTVLDEQGRVRRVMGTVQDITDRKQGDAERKNLQEQLLQAQKIESVGRLAGGVAHDINNMLMPILGYAEMLSMRFPAGDNRREDTEAIIKCANRVRDVTRQLLAFARKQTMELRPLSLVQVVQGFEKMLRRTIREDVRIETRYAPSDGIIMGDAGQIEQVILNLAINAQDAMPDGGVVRIEMADAAFDDVSAAAHKGLSPGQYVMVAVSDTGIGMDAEVREKIFEPFFTTKGVGRGTGLGLSTVYGIVKQHGGYIAVESEPGRGSTFRAYFPSLNGTAIDRLEEKQRYFIGGTETICIVEDQQEVLESAVKMLETCGYRVLQAKDGETALAIIRTYEGIIDLLITDVIMPKMDGKALFEEMSRDRKGLKVLYMSGYPADVISTHGVLHTGANYIQKPFMLSAIANKIRVVLNEKKLARPYGF
jgi:two-component system cell cycle sensor histidine kinase/response regulator CckA